MAERLIERQHQLYGIIARTLDNLKKLGLSNIKRGTVQSRIEALKANWTRFQLIH